MSGGSLEAGQPTGGGDEYVPRCEILPGADGCTYSIVSGGTVSTGSFRADQQPQPQPSQVVNQGGATLDVVVVEGFRISSNDTRRQGPNAPNHARTREAGDEPWVNVRAISAGGEGAQASQLLGGALGTQLVAQDFGFRIPLAAQPELLTVEIDRKGALTEEALSAIVCGAGSSGPATMFMSTDAEALFLVSTDDGSVVETINQTDGAVVADSSGNFYAINPLTKYGPDHSQVWTTAFNLLDRFNEPAYKNVAIDENGRLFICEGVSTSSPLYVRRIDPETGNQLWATDIYASGLGGEQVVLAIQAHAGKVLVRRNSWDFGDTDAVLLDTDGNILQTIEITGTGFTETELATFLGSDGHVYASFYDNNDTGNPRLARKTAPTWSVITAGFYAQVIFFDAVNGALYAAGSTTPFGAIRRVRRYNAQNGAMVWSNGDFRPVDIATDTEGNVYLRHIVVDPGVMNFIVRLDPDDGSFVWESPQLGSGSFTAAGFGVYSADTTLTPINLLLDEGYATAEGTYTCELTPLTVTAQTPGKITATLDLSGWTAEEINDLSFGVTYAAAGSGIVQMDAVRAWVDYSGAFGEALPAKRPLGLAGVAISPTGRRVAVGVNGKALYSDDGQTWQAASVPTNATLLDVVWDYAAGHFVAVGRGVILTGDGATWQRVDAGIPETLWAVAYDRADQVLVAAGDEGVQAAPDDSGQWLTRYQ